MQEMLQSTLINIPVYVILCTCTGMTYDEFLNLYKYFILSLCTNVLCSVLMKFYESTFLFLDYLITELKSYYCECLPFITNQTRNHKDTAPSILEEIASEISAQLEWENEWNSQGLASRLSEQVYP